MFEFGARMSHSQNQNHNQDPNDPIAIFRAAFPKDSSQFIHFNNAGISPLSRPAYQSVQHWAERLYKEASQCVMDGMGAIEKTRADLAKLLGANPESTSFYANTASALSQVAFGLSLQPGHEILLWDQEYPSNFYPWKEVAERSGAILKIARSGKNFETPVETLISCINQKTKVVAVSWVQFQTGAITDLKRLTDTTRSRGIFTVADIIQGAGLLPFDFKESGLDAACGGSHKWLTSPLSTGYLLLREEHIERLNPIAVGAMTFGSPETPTNQHAKAKSNSHRFEPGAKSILDIAAFGASIELFQQVGLARIAQEAEWLARRLVHGLRERGYLINTPHGSHHQGGIVNFAPGADSKFKTFAEIESALSSRQGPQVSHSMRGPGIRFSVHAFNTKEEVDRVLELLA